MRIPPTPPSSDDLYKDTGKLIKILQNVPSPLVGTRYMHWRKVRYHEPPADLTHHEWWMGLKFRRSNQYKSLPLEDKEGKNFVYLTADPIPEIIHSIDLGAG